MCRRWAALMYLFCGLLFSDVYASALGKPDCDGQFACQNEVWIDGVFAHWEEQNRGSNIDYILGRVACKSSNFFGHTTGELIKACKNQLGEKYGCKVTAAMVGDPQIREFLGESARDFMNGCGLE